MPDKQGKLSQEEVEKAFAWFNERAKRLTGSDYHCPLCGDPNWFVAEHLADLKIFIPNVGLSLGSPTYPQIQIICKNCGSTQLLNAVIAGVDPSSSEKKEGGNEQK